MSHRDILSLNAFDPASASTTDPELRAAVDRRHAVFGRDAVLFFREPLRVDRAEDVWIFTQDGERYLDAYNNVPSVGHCNPIVTEAIARQAARLNTHTRYLNDVVDAYAERLLATMPAGLSRLALTCTGSESNDLALRIAQAATGRRGFVVTTCAYHGNSAAVTDISPSSVRGGRLAPHVRAVPPPDPYRGDAADPGGAFARAVSEAIGALEESGHGFAGLVVDTIFSSDGVFPDPPGLLAPAAEIVRRAGGLFIADEVQPGFGRTGAMWGFGRHGVTPDIATLGKPMGNGYPIAGVATRAELLQEFHRQIRYFNTFGGGTLAAAAGAAVLDALEQGALRENAARTGAYLLDGIRALGNRHAVIGDVRGAGLYLGVELVADRATREPAPGVAAALIEELRARRVLIGAAGPFANILKIRPPLTFNRQHADILIDALDGALGGVAGGRT